MPDLSLVDLVTAFRDSGVVEGDNLIVHSSYKSLGRVVGGPETVINALLESIGSRGNLMLPAFNYTRPMPEPYFDPANTPCRTGIIPELGRKRPEAVRSMSPTHSVSVIGPNAEELACDHLRCRTFGVGSPIDRLAKMGGKILLIGVGNDANSTIHIGEEYAGTPKAHWTDSVPVARVLMPDGSIIEHEVDTSSSCSAAFGAVDYVLRRNGEIGDLRVGGCRFQMMRSQDVIRRVCEMISEKQDILLCTWNGCKPCTGARHSLGLS